jgi:hypothetical protein
VLTLIQEYYDLGYNIILSIDESGIFVTDENNETVRMINRLPKNILELHFSATPDLNLEYDKIFVMDDDEIKKTKRVKSKLQLLRLGHTDDYEMINDVIDKLEEITPFYNGHTVSVQFVCETGKDYRIIKKIISDICKSRGIKEDEIFDLSVEGKVDNVDKYDEFNREISTNTIHKYKIILTKYAGTIGFDCPSIAIIALMRKFPKSSEKQKIQIIGRGKRIFNGQQAQNEIQDTVFLFVKDDFVIPSYMAKEISSYESTVYNRTNNLINNNTTLKCPIINELVEDKNFEHIDSLIKGVNYEKIKNQTYTVTTKYDINDNTLSGETLQNIESDVEINYFNEMGLPTAINLVDKLEMSFETLLTNSFKYVLTNFHLNRNELVIDYKNNLKIREFFENLLTNFKKRIKKYEVVGVNNFNFPMEITRHKTDLYKIVDKDSVYYDKILYVDESNNIYFDSTPELIFFDEVISRRQVNWVFQNPRKNQGGISFYIPENDINHSPDNVLSYNNKQWYVEVTSWNRVSEKEKYIKSEGVPDNYMLVALNSKGVLLTLTKDEYDRDTFLNENNWVKLNQRYVSL